ncbi:protein of unknown function [Paraburkholderia kururiensis]
MQSFASRANNHASRERQARDEAGKARRDIAAFAATFAAAIDGEPADAAARGAARLPADDGPAARRDECNGCGERMSRGMDKRDANEAAQRQQHTGSGAINRQGRHAETP